MCRPAPENEVVERLGQLGITFTRHEHPPAATVEEAEPHWAAIDAAHCKNLFLRNQVFWRLAYCQSAFLNKSLASFSVISPFSIRRQIL